MIIEEPTSQVVSAGSDVTFNCSAASSPGRSRVTWKLRGVVQQDGARVRIRSPVRQVNGAMRVDSTLTIFGTSGHDSGRVECLVELDMDTQMAQPVEVEAVLSVLGE